MKTYRIELYENGKLEANSKHWRITIWFFRAAFFAFSLLDRKERRIIEVADDNYGDGHAVGE